MSEPRVTYADILPGKLAAGAEYATVEQILLCDDLPQATLYVPHWRQWIRVRAPSLAEREQIQKLLSVTQQYCLTWQLCCVMPRFTSDQAERLAEKNPDAVEKVARFMWLLAAMDREWIEHVVTAQTDAPGTGDPPPAAP